MPWELGFEIEKHFPDSIWENNSIYFKPWFFTHIALEGCNKRKVVAENHIFVYLGITPNVDLVFPPTFVSCKLKFLVPECEIGLYLSLWGHYFSPARSFRSWVMESEKWVLRQKVSSCIAPAPKEGANLAAPTESCIPYPAPAWFPSTALIMGAPYST